MKPPVTTTRDKPRVLMVSAIPPHPPNFGGAQRTHLLYQALSDRYDVDLLLTGRFKLSPDELLSLRQDFRLLGIEPIARHPLRNFSWKFRYLGNALRLLIRVLLRARMTLFRDSRIAARVERLIEERQYGFIVCRHLNTACMIDAFAQTRVYIDMDDFESEFWASHRSEGLRGRLYKLWTDSLVRSYQQIQNHIFKRCAGVWIGTAQNAALLPHQTPYQLLQNIPFPTQIAAERAAPDHCNDTIIGVAHFGYGPNSAGFDWFVTQVWPLILKARPPTRLLLVGRLSNDALRSRWQAQPGVTILGYVENLDAAYAQASLAVAPIHQGTGTNIKVLEALSHGLCCVCSRHAKRGFENAPALPEADSKTAFAKACVELLGDAERRKTLGAEGRRYVAQAFSFDHFKNSVDQLIDARGQRDIHQRLDQDSH